MVAPVDGRIFAAAKCIGFENIGQAEIMCLEREAVTQNSSG